MNLPANYPEQCLQNYSVVLAVCSQLVQANVTHACTNYRCLFSAGQLAGARPHCCGIEYNTAQAPLQRACCLHPRGGCPAHHMALAAQHGAPQNSILPFFNCSRFHCGSLLYAPLSKPRTFLKSASDRYSSCKQHSQPQMQQQCSTFSHRPCSDRCRRHLTVYGRISIGMLQCSGTILLFLHCGNYAHTSHSCPAGLSFLPGCYMAAPLAAPPCA